MSAEQQATPGASDAGKRDEAVKVLGEILGKMGLHGTFDVKDATDGSISIAMTLDGELPGAAAGKRSHVVDSIQFLINKIVNRTPQNRRWVSLGLGEHPAPRQQKPQKQPAPPAPQVTAGAAAPAPMPPTAQAPVPAAQPRREREPKQQRNREQQPDESTLEVAEDAALTAAAKELAEKSAKHGRLVAVIGLSVDDRARLVKAAKAVSGLSVKVEGDGRNRRVALLPDKPTPMPKQNLPVYDDEEDDEE